MVTLKDILKYNDKEIANLVKFYFPNDNKIEESKEFEFFKQANENNIELLSQKLNENLDEERIDRSWDEDQLSNFEMIKENYQTSFIEKTKKVFAKNIRSLKILIKNKDSLNEINNDFIFLIMNLIIMDQYRLF